MQNFAFRIDQETIDRLDVLAAKIGCTRSKMLRNCLDLGIEDVETFDKLGLLKAATSIRDFSIWIKSGKHHRMLARDEAAI
jgi:predicted DNA-binding protein